MKRLILAVVSVGVIGGATLYLNRQKTAPVSPAEPMAEATSTRTPEDKRSVKTVVVQQTEPQVTEAAADSKQTPLASPVLNEVKPDNATNSTPPTAFRQAIDILVSPQTSFQQRQAAWKQLRDAGELDKALATLKQGAADDPTSAEYPTALGEVYVYKLQTIRDFHEVSILALQADQSFNTALGIEPTNWEAQFFKAAALSRWPPEMNKGPEVIQQFSNQCEDAIKKSIHNVSGAQPVTDFEAIAAGVFKERGVVTGFVVHRPFDVACANLRREFRESVHGRPAFRPERNPVFVGHVRGRLCDSEKFRGHLACAFKLQPSFDGDPLGKPQRREQPLIERGHIGQPGHSQINVVEKPFHFLSSGKFLLKTPLLLIAPRSDSGKRRT